MAYIAEQGTKPVGHVVCLTEFLIAGTEQFHATRLWIRASRYSGRT